MSNVYEMIDYAFENIDAYSEEAAKRKEKALTSSQQAALKKARSKHKTLASLWKESQKHKKARKSKAKISAEAKTVTDNEQMWIIISALFLSLLGALIAWWIIAAGKKKKLEQFAYLINVEAASCITSYNSEKDPDTKQGYVAIFHGIVTKVNKLERQLDGVENIESEYNRIKAGSGYKNYLSFKLKHHG